MHYLERIKRFIRYYSAALRHAGVIDRRKLHAQWEIEHLRKIFQAYAVDCVFDVGANQGQYAQMLRKKVGYKGLIVSFEPIPAMAAQVREQASRDPLWVVCEQALSSSDGAQVLNVMRGSQFSSLSTPRHDEVGIFKNMNVVQEQVSVKTETLATAYKRLKEQHPFQRPFLKMDTQGYDVRIFRSGASVVQEFVGLQSELAIKKIYADSMDFKEALAEYSQAGFSLSALVPNNAGHFPLLVEVDCLMVRTDLIRDLASQ